MTRNIFRNLVLISLSMNMILVFFRDIYWNNFDEDIQRLLEVDGYGSVIPGVEYVFWIILILSITCYVGLYFFRLWSIWLLLFLDIVFLLFLAPFGGVEVSAPVERISGAILFFIDGMLVSLAFFSDSKICNEFKSQKNNVQN